MISTNKKIFIMMLLLFAASQVSAGWTVRPRLIFITGCASMHAMVYIHDK
jgi:hypothetical protein